MRERRDYTDEFKAGAVRLVLDEGKKVAEVARNLDLTPNGEVSATGALDSAAATPVAFAAHVGGGKGSTQPSLGGSRAGDVLAFNSPEHQTYGDEASRAEGRTQPYTKPTPEEQTGKPDPEHFALTHGEAMSLGLLNLGGG